MDESNPSFDSIDLAAPCWTGYRRLLEPLAGAPFPGTAQMNAWLRPGTVNLAGRPIRFVSAAEIPGVEYERHIYETGEVSTRESSLHDVCNALAWSRFPALKAAMNACHYRELPVAGSRQRSRLRDALTLLDESGAIVCSSRTGLLESLARRQWAESFVHRSSAWVDARVLVCGHALLEKFPRPYKSITAHVLLVRDDSATPREQIDHWLAQRLLSGELLQAPAGLSPLPLMGIPGWWRKGPQDREFYDDPRVFRAPGRPFTPPPVHHLGADVGEFGD